MGNESSTKQRIMEVALDLCSQKGVDAVGVEEIARAVGIKAPSLYKHYKNKQAIFDSIMEEMERRYEDETERMYHHISHAENDKANYIFIDEDELVRREMKVVDYLMHDNYVSKFRKLLIVEQFRDKKFSDIYNTRHINFMVTYHKRVFIELINAKVIKDEDPYIMSIQYMAPIFELLAWNDREPEMEERTIDLIEKHIRQFVRVYSN